MADILDVILMLRNVPQFVSGAQEAAASIAGVGVEAEVAGAKAKSGWKGMLKWAAGAAVFVGATRYIKSASEATTQLAQQTLALQRQTGLDTQTASEWVSLTKERGIGSRQLTASLVRLNKAIEVGATGTGKQSQTIADLRKQIDLVAAAGGKDAPKQLAKLSAGIAKAEQAGAKARLALSQLGVPIAELQKGSTAQVLGHVADAVKNMHDPAQRSALMLQLFGRTGQQLLPILLQGSKGIAGLLEEQKAYGNYLTGHTIKDTYNLIRQQHAQEAAFAGVKLQVGQALTPVLITLGRALLAVLNAVRPVTTNASRLRTVLIVLTASLIAWRVAVMALSVVEKIQIGLTKEWTAAQWLLNVALDANVIALVVIAVAALAAGIYLAYRHIGVFREAVGAAWHAISTGARAVFDWLASNWPLLVAILFGPFGIAVDLVVSHFATIKRAALAIVAAVKAAIQDLVRWVTSIPDHVGTVLDRIPGVKTATGVYHGVTSGLSHIFGGATGGVVPKASPVLVGEGGPELLSLPQGATVTPLPALPGGYGHEPLQIVVPVYLDGRVLTESVARVTANRLARR